MSAKKKTAASSPATYGTYSYDDVPLNNWNDQVWRAVYLGQQAQLRRYYVGDEPDGPGMQRVHFFTPTPGSVSLAASKASLNT